jgi:hypothetical protein
MKSPEKDLIGTLPSAENGSTGLHFGVSHYRGTSIKGPPATFHTVSPRTRVNNYELKAGLCGGVRRLGLLGLANTSRVRMNNNSKHDCRGRRLGEVRSSPERVDAPLPSRASKVAPEKPTAANAATRRAVTQWLRSCAGIVFLVRGLAYTQRSKLVKYSPKLVKGGFLELVP